MAYQTIRDLLSQVRSLHSHLRAAIHEAQKREHDERSKLLLSFIEEHQSTLEHALETVERRGPDAILDTWLQFEPNVEVERAMSRAELDSSLTAAEVVNLVLEAENALTRLYELLQGADSSSEVQAFFGGLLEMEDSAVRRSAIGELESRDF